MARLFGTPLFMWWTIGILVLWIVLNGLGARAKPQASRWIPSEIIPSRMVGTHLDEEIHVASVRVGTPERELTVALDFASDGLIVSSTAAGGPTAGDIATSNPVDWSSSYAPVGSGSDMIRLTGDRRYRVPVSHNSQAAALFGCPTCHGVLGIGPGSPIWLVWNRATFSAGTITLGHKQPQVKGAGRARIQCEPLSTDLCVSSAVVYGKVYDVRFQFRSIFTTVPWEVYEKYVGSRSISTVPVRKWPYLKLRFASAEAPVDPRHVTFKIAPQSLLGDSRSGEAQILLLRRSDSSNATEIVLGRSAWRSLMMYREFDTGRAIVSTYHSTKRFPTWSLVVGVVVALVLVRWITTRDALFYEAVPGKLARTGVTAIKSRLQTSSSSSNTRRSRFRSAAQPYEGSYSQQRRLDNDEGIRLENEPHTPWEAIFSGVYPGEWGVYPDRLLIELVAVPGAITSLYIPVLRAGAESKYEFWVFLQVLVYSMVAWLFVVWFARLFGHADIFGVLHFYAKHPGPAPVVPTAFERGLPKSFVIYRAALIRQAAVDILLVTILVMVSTLTRTDNLGSNIIALVVGFLSGLVLYHFMATWVHLFRFNYRYPTGKRGEGVWIMWILFMSLLTLTTAAFCMTFVLIPFMQVHVTSANVGDYLLAAVVVYVFGLLLAFVMVNFEADRMATWLTSVRYHKPPKTRPTTTATSTD